MAFLIRAITYSASGREIVRTQRLEADRLAIGRDPASDIVLDDLTIAPHFALIHRIGPRAAMVTAIAGRPFAIDEIARDRAEIDATAGAELHIGDYRLTLSWDADARAIAILIERFDPAVRSAARRGEPDRFSLAGTLPGPRLLSWCAALIVLALFLAWPIWSFAHRGPPGRTPQQITRTVRLADASWSPGPLSSAHAALARNCAACHASAFVAVRDTSCRACHANVHDHADPARLARALAPNNWAGRLRFRVAGVFDRPPGRCVDCHVEHQGAGDHGNGAMPPPAQKFCADCHRDLVAKLPDTKLADASDFGRDHPQFVATIQLAPGPHPIVRRISLDANPREETGLKFPHALHLSARNGVARMAQTLGQARAGEGLDCAACHQPDPLNGGFKPVTMEADCQSCHSLAFATSGGAERTLRHGNAADAFGELRDYYAAHDAAPALLGGLARRRPGDFAATPIAALAGRGDGATPRAVRALFAPGGACVDCHSVTPPTRAGALDYGIAPVTLPSHYLANGWFDHRAHTTQACADCHAAKNSNDARDVLQPRIAECRNCHSGEHATRAAPVASSCAMCHAYHRDPGLPVSAERRGAGWGGPPALRRTDDDLLSHPGG